MALYQTRGFCARYDACKPEYAFDGKTTGTPQELFGKHFVDMVASYELAERGHYTGSTLAIDVGRV
eukprot:COSAG01_NODE_15695_length_1309_cov_2.839489_1_plen_65_part_10